MTRTKGGPNQTKRRKAEIEKQKKKKTGQYSKIKKNPPQSSNDKNLNVDLALPCLDEDLAESSSPLEEEEQLPVEAVTFFSCQCVFT